jgi:Uma2 family endonuclease
MVMMVEDTYLPATLSVPSLTDAEFRDWCDQYPDYSLEYTADGELIIMPPTDPDTGARSARITKRLGIWADVVRRGIVTDSSTGFVLPNQSRRSPDAAWSSGQRFRRSQSCPDL